VRRGIFSLAFRTATYYGEKAAEYLLGTKVITPYRWLWVVAVLVGSVLSLSTVSSLADVTNGLMAIPNLISLIALNGVIVAELDAICGATISTKQRHRHRTSQCVSAG
jgi:alanine or glycine:cation symporter, AGCS family